MKYLFAFTKKKLMILGALYKCRDDVCGCDMVKKLNIPKNLLSYHIKKLRKEGIIRETKCGNRKVYKIAEGKIKDVRKILEAVHNI